MTPQAAASSTAAKISRVAGLVLTLGCVGWAFAGQWGAVSARIDVLPLIVWAFAALSVLVGLLASGLAWRAVLSGLGHRLAPRQAGRVFFVGQLGKYVPGSVWTVVGQTEAARRYGLARAPVAATALVVMLLNVVTGASVAAATGSGQTAVVIAVAGAAAVALCPPILRRLVRLTGRVINRDLDVVVDARHIAVATGWTLLMWAAYGAHTVLVVEGLQPGLSLAWPTAAGVFAAAWTAGFLAVVAPAGAGVREALIVALLSPETGSAVAGAFAVVSRLLLTMGDIVWAALSLLVRPPAALTSGRNAESD